jgi:hypothetical protein
VYVVHTTCAKLIVFLQWKVTDSFDNTQEINSVAYNGIKLGYPTINFRTRLRGADADSFDYTQYNITQATVANGYL